MFGAYTALATLQSPYDVVAGDVNRDGRVDLMIGRGNTAPVYPWFGKDIRDGIDLAIEGYALLRRLWDEEVVDWEGRFRTPSVPLPSAPARPRPRPRHGGAGTRGDRRVKGPRVTDRRPDPRCETDVWFFQEPGW